MFKIKAYNTIVCLMAVYMFTTLTYTLWPISSPNKIVGFLLFFNVVWIYCAHLTKKKIIVLFIALLVVGWSLLNSTTPFGYISDAIYLLISILLLMEIDNDFSKKKILCSLEESEKFIKFFVILCDLFLCVGFFDSRCYDSSQWDGSYFRGYTNASHTMASGACLLLVFTLYMIRNKRKISSFIYFVPSIIAILKSGARTFLIPIIIVCLFFYIYHIKSFSIRLLAFPVVIISAIYIFLNSSMIEKFIFSVNNQYTDMNFWGRLTNGRTAFWLVDLLAFVSYNIIQKLLGNGFDYVYMVNEKNFNLAIWAHNDFINCLLSVGLIGTVLYMYMMYRTGKQIIKMRRRNIIIKTLLIAYMFLPAFLNGFYTYQHYFYSFILLVILYEKYYCEMGKTHEENRDSNFFQSE